MRRAIIRELKKKPRRKGLRKFELVGGSFQELGDFYGAPGESAELLQALWVLKGVSLETPWSSWHVLFRRAVSKSTLKMVGSLGRSSNWMGVRSQNRKITRAWWRWEIYWTYFSSDKKRLGSLWGWDFGGAWGVYSVFILEDVVDKRLDVTSVISSAVPLRLFCRKRFDCWFWKSPGLACLVSQEQEQQRFLLSWLKFLAGGSQVYLVDGKNEALLNVLQRAFWVSDPFYARLCCSSNGATRRLPKEGARQDARAARAGEVGLYSASGRHRWAWGYCGFCASKRSRADRFAYLEIAFKRSPAALFL